jgi:hypothetical protein
MILIQQDIYNLFRQSFVDTDLEGNSSGYVLNLVEKVQDIDDQRLNILLPVHILLLIGDIRL